MASKANKRRKKREELLNRKVIGGVGKTTGKSAVRARPAPGTRIYRSGGRVQTTSGTYQGGEKIKEADTGTRGAAPITRVTKRATDSQAPQKQRRPARTTALQPAKTPLVPVTPAKVITPKEKAINDKVNRRKLSNEYHGLGINDPRRKEIEKELRGDKTVTPSKYSPSSETQSVPSSKYAPSTKPKAAGGWGETAVPTPVITPEQTDQAPVEMNRENDKKRNIIEQQKRIYEEFGNATDPEKKRKLQQQYNDLQDMYDGKAPSGEGTAREFRPMTSEEETANIIERKKLLDDMQFESDPAKKQKMLDRVNELDSQFNDKVLPVEQEELPPLELPRAMTEDDEAAIVSKYQAANTPEHRQELRDKSAARKTQRDTARQNAVQKIQEAIARTSNPEVRARRQEQLNQLTGTQPKTLQEQITDAYKYGDIDFLRQKYAEAQTEPERSAYAKMIRDVNDRTETEKTKTSISSFNNYNKMTATQPQRDNKRLEANEIKNQISDKIDTIVDPEKKKSYRRRFDELYRQSKNKDMISFTKQKNREIAALNNSVDNKIALQKEDETIARGDEARKEQVEKAEKEAEKATKDTERQKKDASTMLNIAKDGVKDAEKKYEEVLDASDGESEEVKDARKELKTAKETEISARNSLRGLLTGDDSSVDPTPVEDFDQTPGTSDTTTAAEFLRKYQEQHPYASMEELKRVFLEAGFKE